MSCLRVDSFHFMTPVSQETLMKHLPNRKLTISGDRCWIKGEDGFRKVPKKNNTVDMLEHLKLFPLPNLLEIKLRFNNILKAIKQNYRSRCNLIQLDRKAWVESVTIASFRCLTSLDTSSPVPPNHSLKDWQNLCFVLTRLISLLPTIVRQLLFY